MAAECVFLSWVLYNVFLLSYVCSPRPNDLLHHLKEKGLKSSTFCTVIHGFRDSVVTLLRNRVNFFRHLGYLAHRRKTFLSSSLAHYPNSVAGFRLIRLLFCGDISPNPGPAPNCNKKLRSVCRRSVAHNHRAIQCHVCLCWCHIKCGKVTPAEYTKLAPFTVSFPWSCPACVTSSKNLPFADIRNPSSDLDLSSDGDKSILNESSDNINIVHVQSTPSPNSSLSTCQLPAPPTHTKVSSGWKGWLSIATALRVHLVSLNFKFFFTFTNLISSSAVNQSLTAKCQHIHSSRPSIPCSERTEIVMGEVCSRRLSPKSFARKCLTLEKIAKSSGHQLRSVTVKLST